MRPWTGPEVTGHDVPVTWKTYVSDHLSGIIAGNADAGRFLADRFAGEPVEPNCQHLIEDATPVPLRPGWRPPARSRQFASPRTSSMQSPLRQSRSSCWNTAGPGPKVRRGRAAPSLL